MITGRIYRVSGGPLVPREESLRGTFECNQNDKDEAVWKLEDGDLGSKDSHAKALGQAPSYWRDSEEDPVRGRKGGLGLQDAWLW